MGSIRKHGAGYEGRYRDPAGRLRGKTFRTKAEARAFLAQIEADKLRGTFIDPQLGRVRFVDWAAEWWDTSTAHLKPKTRAHYDSLLRCYIIPKFGSTPLQGITTPHVKSFVSALGEGGLSASRQRQVYRLLSMILKAAVEAGCIGRSPCIGVKIKPEPKREHLILTPQQVTVLAQNTREPYDVLCYLLAFGGPRWGEIAALRRSRCDPLRSRIEIVDSVAEIFCQLYLGPTKTYARRWARLPRVVSDILAHHLAANVPGDPNALVFTAPNGGPLRYNNFRNRVWAPALQAAGSALPYGFTPHHLRHTCASLLIRNRASVKAVQQQLGHSSPTVTLNVYAHLFDDDLDNLFEGLNETLRAAVEAPDVVNVWSTGGQKVVGLQDGEAQ